MKRIATMSRETKETSIKLTLNLDGQGEAKISTGIGFFDHMITAFAAHSGFDIDLYIKGDLEVDNHHTVEDAGIVLGKAIKKALSDKRGIVRFSNCFLPMDESLAFASLDISGRSFLVFDALFDNPFCGDYQTDVTEEFFRALAFGAEVTLHMRTLYGSNDHHKIEALYKAVARCFRQAVKVEGDKIPSSKGLL